MCLPVGETRFNMQSAKLFAQLWRRDSCCQAAQRCAQHVTYPMRSQKASGEKKFGGLSDEACTDMMVGSSLTDDGT